MHVLPVPKIEPSIGLGNRRLGHSILFALIFVKCVNMIQKILVAS